MGTPAEVSDGPGFTQTSVPGGTMRFTQALPRRQHATHHRRKRRRRASEGQSGSAAAATGGPFPFPLPQRAAPEERLFLLTFTALSKTIPQVWRESVMDAPPGRG